MKIPKLAVCGCVLCFIQFKIPLILGLNTVFCTLEKKKLPVT